MFVQNAGTLELHVHTLIIMICVHEIENVEMNKLHIKYILYHCIFGNLSMFSFLTRLPTLYIRLPGNLCPFFFFIFIIFIQRHIFTLSFFPFDWSSHLSFLFNLDYPSLVGKPMGKITFTSVWIYTSIIQYEYIIVFRYASLRFKTTIASNHKNNTNTCFIPWGDVSSKHNNNNNTMTSNKSWERMSYFHINVIFSYDYYLLL